MTIKEELIQEIEQSPEPLLAEVLEFIYSRKQSPVNSVEAYLDERSASDDYADDVTDDRVGRIRSGLGELCERERPGCILG